MQRLATKHFFVAKWVHVENIIICSFGILCIEFKSMNESNKKLIIYQLQLERSILFNMYICTN